MSEHEGGSLRDSVERLTAAIARYESLQDGKPAMSRSATATNVFNINAGGIASIIAVGIAVLALAMQWQGQQKQLSVDAEQNDDTREVRANVGKAQDYLNALYRQYPELRPELVLKQQEESKP